MGNLEGDNAKKPVADTPFLHSLRSLNTVQHVGKVVQAFATSIRVTGLPAKIGQRCEIKDKNTKQVLLADVVGFSQEQTILFPLGSLQGVAIDSEVSIVNSETTVPVSLDMCGGVFDGLAKPLDQSTIPLSAEYYSLESDSPHPLLRRPITQPFNTGVKVIDSLLSMGIGQRMGVFAMAGGGKSTLLGMLAKYSTVDVIVVALIGERGRELREFIDHSLGPEGLKRSVVVVSTSDRPAMERVKAAHTATAIAEGFRDQGKNVLLLMDSVTRYARALREIGLSVGEPPVRQGFPPSVFAELPKLFERTGNNHLGSITAFYTVLVEDEQGNDPIAEEVRSILDGHIVLSRKLGEQGHYPAVDALASVSRVFTQVTDEAHQRYATKLRLLMSKYREIEFLVQVGEYEAGSDAVADEAIAKKDKIATFLQQTVSENYTALESIEQLSELLE